MTGPIVRAGLSFGAIASTVVVGIAWAVAAVPVKVWKGRGR